jgi:hypothetical protein
MMTLAKQSKVRSLKIILYVLRVMDGEFYEFLCEKGLDFIVREHFNN